MPFILSAIPLAAFAVTAVWLLPGWATVLIQVALGKGLVVLGLVALLRCGLLSFGHGLFYATGAYTVALVGGTTGITDALVLTLCGAVSAGLIAAGVGPLLVRYRGIFFAMLSLALSMIAHSLLMQTPEIGGSDGLSANAVTYFGLAKDRASIYELPSIVTVVVAATLAFAIAYLFRSRFGLTSRASGENELRLEYLGVSAKRVIYRNLIASGALGGAGGALVAATIGHVSPDYAYWTTSGEFIFIAIVGGTSSVGAIFLASVLLELARSVAMQAAPHTWQMTLGIFLFLTIVFAPNGLGDAVRRLARNLRAPRRIGQTDGNEYGRST